MELSTYAELSQQIDRQFPFPTLVKWADEVTDIGNYNDSDSVKKIKTLSNNPFYKSTILPLLQSTITNPDVTIEQPSGDQVEILHGSVFYTEMFQLLGDREVDRALRDSSDYLLGEMPRDVFFTGLFNSATLIGLLIVPHSFKQDEIVQIAKYSLDKVIYGHPHYGLDFRESTLLLYANMKVLANKLFSQKTRR